MYLKFCKKYFFFIGFFILISFISAPDARAENLAHKLSGKILLQVESLGEAWYVNPLNLKRYYLGRPDDAFNLMRELGLGISESDYQKFSQQGASNLKGRILLRVQASGEAYYVNPENSQLHYLGRPADAFNLMRELGLGISNNNLNTIIIDESSVVSFEQKSLGTYESEITHSNDLGAKIYNWRYQNQDYSLNFNLDSNLYQIYQDAPKVYTYYQGNEPVDFRDAFYAMFLQNIPEDNQSLAVLEDLKSKANHLGLSPDERAAFIMAFIQYLEYDRDKADSGINNPYYPFETLYLQKGICSDTTFLAVSWLRELGYGAAILDFPESNHSAAGIACPLSDSLDLSGYCYIETTNYFPIGVVPGEIVDGQASDQSANFDNFFSADRLGTMEIKQASKGRVYQGVSQVRQEINYLKQAQHNLDALQLKLNKEKEEIDIAYELISERQSLLLSYHEAGDINAYNQAVPAYNEMVRSYQVKIDEHQDLIEAYNQNVSEFNIRYFKFYQY